MNQSRFPEETSVTSAIGGCCTTHASIEEAVDRVTRAAAFVSPLVWTDSKEHNKATGCNYVIRSASQMGSDNKPRHVGSIFIKGVTPARGASSCK